MGITLSGSRPLILSFPYSCFHSSTFIFNSALAWKNKCSIDSYCHYGNASKAFKTPNPLDGKTRLPQSYFPSPWTLNSIALFPSLFPSPLICLKTLLMSYHSLIDQWYTQRLPQGRCTKVPKTEFMAASSSNTSCISIVFFPHEQHYQPLTDATHLPLVTSPIQSVTEQNQFTFLHSHKQYHHLPLSLC